MPTDLNSFGAYLRERRRALHLSQRALAGVLGIDFSYLSKLENGREEPPSEDTLRRLAKALGVPEEHMIAMSGKLTAELRRRAGADPQFAYLLRRLPSLSKRSLERIFEAAGIDPPEFKTTDVP